MHSLLYFCGLSLLKVNAIDANKCKINAKNKCKTIRSSVVSTMKRSAITASKFSRYCITILLAKLWDESW